MTLQELREYISRQAQMFHAIEDDSALEWEMLEFSTFKKIFDYIVDNNYYHPSKGALEEFEEEFSAIHAMEAIDEAKDQMPHEIKELLAFFYHSFYPEDECN